MRQDRISGAAEIETKVKKYISKYIGKKELFEKCLAMLSIYPSMASIWNIANFIFLYGKDANEKFEEMKVANKKVVENGVKAIKDGYTILTYSRSSTVTKILEACKDKEIKIKNFYFDATPCKYITAFITENGISKERPSFKFEIADEINKIKELLSRKFHLVK